VIISGTATVINSNLYDLFESNFTSTQRVLAEDDTVIARSKQKFTNQWTWGKHAFIDPEELASSVIPSFYDAGEASAEFIQNGHICKDDLKYIGANETIMLNAGGFYCNSLEDYLFPSESVKCIFTAGALSLVFPVAPDLTSPVMVKIYKRENGIPRESIRYTYTPVSQLDNNNYHFKFTISNGTYTVILNKNNDTSSRTVTLTGYKTTNAGNLFLFPEFPLSSVNVSLPAGSITDLALGAILTSATSVTATYTVAPLVVYKPKNTVFGCSQFTNVSVLSDNFLLLTFDK